MTKEVKQLGGRRLRQDQVALTERRLLEAAIGLFTGRGYVNTSLTDVAQAAGVAPRTVYVRFGTKANLLEHCIRSSFGEAFRIAALDLGGRQPELTAPTLGERIRAFAATAGQILERSSPLLAVAAEAAATEPQIAASEQAGHRAALRDFREFAAGLAAEEMLPNDLEADVLADLLWALAGPRALVSFARDREWTGKRFARWLEIVLTRLLAPHHAAATPPNTKRP